MKKSPHGDGLLVVDGQQRVTTALLLLAAVRDLLLAIPSCAGTVKAKVESTLENIQA